MCLHCRRRPFFLKIAQRWGNTTRSPRSYNVQASEFTFAEVFGIERQAVSRQRLQQQLVAGPPAGLWDGGSDALHGRHALEEGRLAMEPDQLVELRQDAVALNLLLLGQLRAERKHLRCYDLLNAGD